MPRPLNEEDTESLLARKEALVGEVMAQLRAHGLAPDYAHAVMLRARDAGLPPAEHVALLERLVALEAIKYTLCARRLRAVDPDADA